MLSFQQINKSFGSNHVLRDLSFFVLPGEIFGFVGSNGAGKTTAMRIALRLLSLDSGEVTWNGDPLDFEARRRIGYMPEERGLYPKMTVASQLIYFARLHGLSQADAETAMEKWTEQLEIAHRRDDDVQKLSLGNQQRVQLAAALIHDPDLLILDEPFSGLDPVAVNVMSQVLRKKANSGVPVIFSSHQLDLVEKFCDRVGILSAGHIVADGTVNELRQTARPVYALAVEGSANTVFTAFTNAGFSPRRDPLDGSSEAPTFAGTTRIVVELDNDAQERELLELALTVGSVREFSPRRPHLTELFKDYVVASPAASKDMPASKKNRGGFGGLSNFGGLLSFGKRGK